MLSVAGTYKDGVVTLDEEYNSEKPVKVILTFWEEVKTETPKRLTTDDFNFKKCQELLKDLKSSLSDAVIEERRSAL